MYTSQTKPKASDEDKFSFNYIKDSLSQAKGSTTAEQTNIQQDFMKSFTQFDLKSLRQNRKKAEEPVRNKQLYHLMKEENVYPTQSSQTKTHRENGHRESPSLNLLKKPSEINATGKREGKVRREINFLS